MADDDVSLLKKVRLLRIAQQLLEQFRAQEIAPEEWKIVVRFLHALSESKTTDGALHFIEQQILSLEEDDLNG